MNGYAERAKKSIGFFFIHPVCFTIRDSGVRFRECSGKHKTCRYWRYSSTLVCASICGHPAVDRAVSPFCTQILASPFSEGFSILGAGVCGSFPLLLPRDRTVSDRAYLYCGLRAFHHPAVGPVYRVGRHLCQGNPERDPRPSTQPFFLSARCSRRSSERQAHRCF